VAPGKACAAGNQPRPGLDGVRALRTPAGRKLIDVPGYTYRVFVTNRPDAPEELWRDYNQRACVEQRICELGHFKKNCGRFNVTFNVTLSKSPKTKDTL
jgi:hypothetical protein